MVPVLIGAVHRRLAALLFTVVVLCSIGLADNVDGLVLNDLPIKPWRVLHPSSLPRPVHHASLVVVNESLALLGGCVQQDCARSDVSLSSEPFRDELEPAQYNSALLLDLNSGKTYANVPSLPPLAEFGPYSGQHAAVAINNAIYIVRACAAFFGDVSALHNTTDEESEALRRVAVVYVNTLFVNESFYTIPSERARVNASCVAVGNRIYIVGGYLVETGAVTESVDTLDITTKHFYTNVAALEEPVLAPALASMSNGFIVVGGLTAATSLSTDAMPRDHTSTLVTVFISQAYAPRWNPPRVVVESDFCVARLDSWWPEQGSLDGVRSRKEEEEDAFVVQIARKRALRTRDAPALHALLTSATWDSLHVFVFAAHVFIMNANGTTVLSMRLHNDSFDLQSVKEMRSSREVVVASLTAPASFSAQGENETTTTTATPETTTTTETPETTTTTTTTTEAPPQPGEPTIEFAMSLVFGFPRIQRARIPHSHSSSSSSSPSSSSVIEDSDEDSLYDTTVLFLVRLGGNETWTVRDVRTGEVLERVERASQTVFVRTLPDDDNEESLRRHDADASADVVEPDALVLPTPTLPQSGVLVAPRGLLTLTMPDLDFSRLCAPRHVVVVGASQVAEEQCAVRLSGRRDCIGNAAGTLDVLYDGAPALNLTFSASGSAFPIYVCVAYIAEFPPPPPSHTESENSEKDVLACPPSLMWTPVNLLAPLSLEASDPPPPPPTDSPQPDPTVDPTKDPDDDDKKDAWNAATLISIILLFAFVTCVSLLIVTLVITQRQNNTNAHQQQQQRGDYSFFSRAAAHPLGSSSSRRDGLGVVSSDLASLVPMPPFAAPPTEADRKLWWFCGPRQASPRAPRPPRAALHDAHDRHRARVAAAQEMLAQQASRYGVVSYIGQGPSSLVFAVYAAAASQFGGRSTAGRRDGLREQWDDAGGDDPMHLYSPQSLHAALARHVAYAQIDGSGNNHSNNSRGALRLDDSASDANEGEEERAEAITVPLLHHRLLDSLRRPPCHPARRDSHGVPSPAAMPPAPPPSPPTFVLKYIQCARDSTRAAITKCCEELRDLESYHPFLVRPFDLFVNYEVNFGVHVGIGGMANRGGGGRGAGRGGAARALAAPRGRRTARFEEPNGATQSDESEEVFGNDRHNSNSSASHGELEEEEEDEGVLGVRAETGAQERVACTLDRPVSTFPFYWASRQRLEAVLRGRSPRRHSPTSPHSHTQQLQQQQQQQQYWSLCLVMQRFSDGNLKDYIAARLDPSHTTSPPDASVSLHGQAQEDRGSLAANGKAVAAPQRVLTECAVASVAYQLSSALHALHSHTTPMIHGNVKLSNVLLRKPRRARRVGRQTRAQTPHGMRNDAQAGVTAVSVSTFTSGRADKDDDDNEHAASRPFSFSTNSSAQRYCLPTCVRQLRANDPEQSSGTSCSDNTQAPLFVPVVLTDAGMSCLSTEELQDCFEVALAPLTTRRTVHTADVDEAQDSTAHHIDSSAAAEAEAAEVFRQSSLTSPAASSSSSSSSKASTTMTTASRVRWTGTALTLSPQGQRWRRDGELTDLVNWMLLYLDLPMTLPPERVLMHALTFSELFVNVPIATAASPFLSNSAASRLAGVRYEDIVPYWPEQLIVHGGITLPALQAPLQRRYLSGLQVSQFAAVGEVGSRAPRRGHRLRRHNTVEVAVAAATPACEAAASSRASSHTTSSRANKSVATAHTNATTATRTTDLSLLEQRSRRRRAPFQLYWHALMSSGVLLPSSGNGLSGMQRHNNRAFSTAGLFPWSLRLSGEMGVTGRSSVTPPTSPYAGISVVSEHAPQRDRWQSQRTQPAAASAITTTTTTACVHGGDDGYISRQVSQMPPESTRHRRDDRRGCRPHNRAEAARTTRSTAAYSEATTRTATTTTATTRTATTSNSDVDFFVLASFLLERDACVDAWGLGVVLYQCLTPAALAFEARQSCAARTTHSGSDAGIALTEAQEEAFYLTYHLSGRALVALTSDLLGQSLEALATVGSSASAEHDDVSVARDAADRPLHSAWAASLALEASLRSQILEAGYTDYLATLVASLLSPVPARRPRMETILQQLRVGYACAVEPPRTSAPSSSSSPSPRVDCFAVMAEAVPWAGEGLDERRAIVFCAEDNAE